VIADYCQTKINFSKALIHICPVIASSLTSSFKLPLKTGFGVNRTLLRVSELWKMSVWI
jgi:hypothetical protein